MLLVSDADKKEKSSHKQEDPSDSSITAGIAKIIGCYPEKSKINFSLVGEDQRKNSGRLNWIYDLKTNRGEIFNTLYQNLIQKAEKEGVGSLKTIIKSACTDGFNYNLKAKAITAPDSLTKGEKDSLIFYLAQAQLNSIESILNHAINAEGESVNPLSRLISQFGNKSSMRHTAAGFVYEETEHEQAFTRLLNLLGKEPKPALELAIGYTGYKWFGPLVPKMSVVAVLMIEIVGGTFFEYLGLKSPYKELGKLSNEIYDSDEIRHVTFCLGAYKELVGKGDKLTDKARNYIVSQVLINHGYKRHLNETSPIFHACRVLGMDPNAMLKMIGFKMVQNFRAIGYEFDPRKFKIDVDPSKVPSLVIDWDKLRPLRKTNEQRESEWALAGIKA